MSVYQKITEQARKFDAAYLEHLSARLQWWGEALGIDRFSLLRMIGMSRQQAARRKCEDLEELLKDPEWEENAQVLEERLHRLLSLFHYDWHALAERLHEPVVETGSEEGRDRRHATPNSDATERLGGGVPRSLSALWAYLAESKADAERTDS